MRQTAGGRRIQRKSFGAGGKWEGGGNRGDASNGWTRGYVGALPPASALTVPGQEDVEHDPDREGGEVPDGLLYLLECVRPGPQA